jgi:phosphatidate cytidylyltransferase
VRTRAISSTGVVIVGLIPALFGGPIYAALMLALGLLGFREYASLAGQAQRRNLPASVTAAGSAVIVMFVVAALLQLGEPALTVSAFAACAIPLVVSLRNEVGQFAFSSWAFSATGTLYLGIPIYSAIALRADASPVDAAWVVELTDRLAFGWAAAPGGFAWTLVVILATWIGDSAALLIGRRVGRRKLAPELSPNKTVEGALAGLIGSALAGTGVVLACGLGSASFGFLVGTVIGLFGQLGDLGESFLKRQARVKDSSSLIPGHGGVLDRIDALLFAFPVGFAISFLSGRWAW